MRLIFSRLTLIWLVLLLGTLISVEAAQGTTMERVRATILVISFIKARLVVSEFMEVRSAPFPMKMGADIWLSVACGVLLWLCLGT